MDQDKLNNHREEGRRVWQSVTGQMAEAGGFFNGMCRTLIDAVKQYFWSLLILGILGALLAGGIWWMKPSFYNAGMTVSYVHYEKKIYADMLEKLDHLLQAGETKKPADILGMDEADIKGVHFIRSYNIRKEPLTEDLSTEKLPFYIEVGVADPAILPALQDALVNYLNSTDFIRSRLQFMKEKAEDELRFLLQRLAIADSLSKMYILPREGIKDDKAITRMGLLEESMAIYERIQEVKGLLRFNLNVEVLDGFIAHKNKAGKDLVNYLILGFAAGIALRVVIRIFR